MTVDETWRYSRMAESASSKDRIALRGRAGAARLVDLEKQIGQVLPNDLQRSYYNS
jgi:hypothetical protein